MKALTEQPVTIRDTSHSQMLKEFQWIEEITTNILYNIGSRNLKKEDVRGLFVRLLMKFNRITCFDVENKKMLPVPPILSPLVTERGKKVAAKIHEVISAYRNADEGTKVFDFSDLYPWG